jgi:hypothetical protein
VETAVAVDEEHRRRRREAIERRPDERELALREVRGNVREANGSRGVRLVDHRQVRCTKDDGRGEPAIPFV